MIPGIPRRDSVLAPSRTEDASRRDKMAWSIVRRSVSPEIRFNDRLSQLGSLRDEASRKRRRMGNHRLKSNDHVGSGANFSARASDPTFALTKFDRV